MWVILTEILRHMTIVKLVNYPSWLINYIMYIISVYSCTYAQVKIKLITIIQFKLYIFLEKRFKLYIILAYTFFNYTFLKYIMVSHYIYIYIYMI